MGIYLEGGKVENGCLFCDWTLEIVGLSYLDGGKLEYFDGGKYDDVVVDGWYLEGGKVDELDDEDEVVNGWYLEGGKVFDKVEVVVNGGYLDGGKVDKFWGDRKSVV